MRLAYKVELQSTSAEWHMLMCHAGCSRFVYNWGLAKYKEAHEKWVELGRPKKWKEWPYAYGLSKDLVKLKHLPAEEGGLPWLKEYSKSVPEMALQALEFAFKNFLAGRAKYPKFKSRNEGIGRFAIAGDIIVKEKYIQVPRHGRIRIKPGNHNYIPPGKYPTARIVEKNGRWYLSVVRPEIIEPPNNGLPVVGIDLGVTNLAVLSDGTIYSNPKALAREQRKIKILQRRKDKKERGSSNRKKAQKKFARAHARVANIRLDNQHKVSTAITKNHGLVVIESIKMTNLTKKGKGKKGLNRALSDAALGQFRDMIEYKGKRFGCEVRLVNPAYTSQMCSKCGHTERGNRRSQSSFVCLKCGFVLNADLNAAINIKVAGGCPDTINACGEVDSKASLVLAERTPMKQESVTQQCVITSNKISGFGTTT